MKTNVLNEPFQLFFSGCEPEIYYEITTKETDTILFTYMYAQKKGNKFMKERIEKTPNVRMLVDSGAHTFLADSDTYADKPVEWFEEYLKGYVKFLKDNKEHIFAAVELDIARLVGQDKVNEWRKNIFEKLTREEGIQIIYVWHIDDGVPAWEKMCQRYPYVGVTFLEGLEAGTIMRDLFSTARKYGTRVHGFGITGYGSLSKYPFFSVDSSTWLVGSQFGELSWFDGRKLFRLKKSDWKKLYKTKIIKMGGNWNLLEREDPYEMIRLNVLTFLNVKAHIRKKMGNKAYWINAPIVSAKEEEMEEETEQVNAYDYIPSAEWFEGEMEDIIEVAENLRIDLRLTTDDVLRVIKGYYAFCVSNEPEQWVTADDMYFFLDAFGDMQVNTTAKAKRVLKTYFKENLLGQRDDLANMKRKTGSELLPKERDEYITDEKFIDVPLTPAEVSEIKKLLAPPEESSSGMEEVEAYDAELREKGITVITESGEIVGATKKVRRNRKLLSNRVSMVACDTCYKGQDCPYYMEGCVCALDREFKKFDCRDVIDVQDAMYGIVNANLERMNRAMFFEMQDGGLPDPVVTDLMERNIKYLSKLQDLATYGRQIHVERKVVTEDGKVETTETIRANPQQGGLLSQIFGGMENTRSSVNEARERMERELEEEVRKNSTVIDVEVTSN